VIVTDDCGCHPDLITNGVEGFVYPVRDVAALEKALRSVFATPETASAMGKAALQRIDCWSFDHDIDGLKAALHHVTRKLPGASAAVGTVHP
jgi:glycosyltransferase involved in cell wall biosynthesis